MSAVTEHWLGAIDNITPSTVLRKQILDLVVRETAVAYAAGQAAARGDETTELTIAMRIADEAYDRHSANGNDTSDLDVVLIRQAADAVLAEHLGALADSIDAEAERNHGGYVDGCRWAADQIRALTTQETR